MIQDFYSTACHAMYDIHTNHNTSRPRIAIWNEWHEMESWEKVDSFNSIESWIAKHRNVWCMWWIAYRSGVWQPILVSQKVTELFFTFVGMVRFSHSIGRIKHSTASHFMLCMTYIQMRLIADQDIDLQRMAQIGKLRKSWLFQQHRIMNRSNIITYDTCDS